MSPVEKDSKEDSNQMNILNDNFHRNKPEIVPWLSIRNRRSSVTKNNNNTKKSTRAMVCFLIHMSFVERESTTRPRKSLCVVAPHGSLVDNYVDPFST